MRVLLLDGKVRPSAASMMESDLVIDISSGKILKDRWGDTRVLLAKELDRD